MSVSSPWSVGGAHHKGGLLCGGHGGGGAVLRPAAGPLRHAGADVVSAESGGRLGGRERECVLLCCRYCEDSLAESVATLIWVAPRLSADVQELNHIAHQLENKFGKPFAQQARSNMSGTVNAKVRVCVLRAAALC